MHTSANVRLSMNKGKQGIAVAVVVIGLIIVGVGAGVLVNELRTERREHKRLEQKLIELRTELEQLKARSPVIWTSTLLMPSERAQRPAVATRGNAGTS